MPNVRNVIKSAAGTPLQNVLVTIELGTIDDDGNFTQNLGFVDIDPNVTTDYSVDYTINTAGFTTTDSNGVWQVTLYGNDGILNPLDSRYKVTETYQGFQRSYYIRVPVDAPTSPATAYWIGDIVDNTITILGSTVELRDLADVDPTLSPNLNQALIWDGSKWVAGNVSVGGGGVVPGEPTEDAIPNYPDASPDPSTAINYPLEHVDDTRPALPGYHAADHEQMRVEIIAIAEDLIAARGGTDGDYANFADKMTALDETVGNIITGSVNFYYHEVGTLLSNQPLSSNTTGDMLLLDTPIFIPGATLNLGDRIYAKFESIWLNEDTLVTLQNLYKIILTDGTTETEVQSDTQTQASITAENYRTTTIDANFIVVDGGFRYFTTLMGTTPSIEIGAESNSWESSGTGNVASTNIMIGNGFVPLDTENDISIDLTSRLTLGFSGVGEYAVQLIGAFATLTRNGTL